MSIDHRNQAEIFSELIDRLPDDQFAKPQLSAHVQPPVDLSSAIANSLAAPEFYPPLNQSVFPGDTVAIVLQSDLPQPRRVLGSLLEQLGKANVAVSDIVVVITRRTADELEIDPGCYELQDEHTQEGSRPPVFTVDFDFNQIRFQVHDPENQAGLSYLVANAEGEPVHVNRLLVDADVILPVGSPAPGDINQQSDCVYPDFSNTENQHRFAQQKGSFISRWQEIELANDTLGSFFVIQIVCGPGDSIRSVVCGARKDALKSARESTNELWSLAWPGKSDVTVATIESHSGDQTWDDFANALVAASRVSTPKGPIIIWSDIAVAPDRNTRKACVSQFEETISSKLTKQLQYVAAVIAEHPVYLRSQLQPNAVEELGLGFVKSVDEILRIAENHGPGLLIRDAQKCQIVSKMAGQEDVAE